jgi:hypothetical protein
MGGKMPEGGWFIIASGGLFILLGLGAYIWGRSEEKAYYDSMPARNFDVREYLERLPFRPEPASLKLGAWICMSVGLVLLIAGGVMWLRR